MRKPASGLAASLWITLGLVLLYLGGARLILLDAGVFGGVLYRSLPEPVIEAIIVLYSPLGEILSFLIPMNDIPPMTRHVGGIEIGPWILGGFVAAGVLVLSIFICGIAMPELVDGRFRTYKQFYRDIEIGMTRQQVLEAMEMRYSASPARQRPKIMSDTAERLGFFMNPEKSSEPNCEGIFLSLKNGKVARKEYSSD